MKGYKYRAKASCYAYAGNSKVNKFHGNLYTPELPKYNVLGASTLQSNSTQAISINIPFDITEVAGSLEYT